PSYQNPSLVCHLRFTPPVRLLFGFGENPCYRCSYFNSRLLASKVRGLILRFSSGKLSWIFGYVRTNSAYPRIEKYKSGQCQLSSSLKNECIVSIPSSAKSSSASWR